MRRAAEYSCGAYCIAWSANVAGSATTSDATRPSVAAWRRAVLVERRDEALEQVDELLALVRRRAASSTASMIAGAPRRDDGVQPAALGGELDGDDAPVVLRGCAPGASPAASIRCIARVTVEGSTRRAVGQVVHPPVRRGPTSRSSTSRWPGSMALGLAGRPNRSLDEHGRRRARGAAPATPGPSDPSPTAGASSAPALAAHSARMPRHGVSVPSADACSAGGRQLL